MSGIGTPKTRPCPMMLKVGASKGAVSPPVKTRERPSTMLIIPRVAMSALIPRRVTKRLLSNPMPAPRASTRRAASHTLVPPV